MSEIRFVFAALVLHSLLGDATVAAAPGGGGKRTDTSVLQHHVVFNHNQESFLIGEVDKSITEVPEHVELARETKLLLLWWWL